MTLTSNTILIVDDNEDDIYALKRAIKKSGIVNPLQVVMDGQQAIDYLAGEGSFGDRERHPLPFLMFLDLKLPYRSGFDVLNWMREQATPFATVVVVLSGSDETKDHQRAYALGARSYLVKPPGPADILQLLEAMRSYWTRESETGPVQSHPA